MEEKEMKKILINLIIGILFIVFISIKINLIGKQIRPRKVSSKIRENIGKRIEV
jgi:hypothetical protein